MRRILAALPLCLATFSLIALSLMPAEARPRVSRAAVQTVSGLVCDNDGRCREGGSVAPQARRGVVLANVGARTMGGRPAGCPRAWCGCWLGHRLGMTDRSLWLARNWARVGSHASGPAPGVIAVYARGRRGGHVGIVTAVPGPGRIVLLSGNDGRAVRERERSTRGVIAWRHLGSGLGAGL